MTWQCISLRGHHLSEHHLEYSDTPFIVLNYWPYVIVIYYSWQQCEVGTKFQNRVTVDAGFVQTSGGPGACR